MRIEKLTLTNYRCFEHREIEFAPGFNVLIGENGAGKTTIIEALTTVVSHFLVGLGLIHAQSAMPTPEQVREVGEVQGETWVLTRQHPCSVEATGSFHDTIGWSAGRKQELGRIIGYDLLGSLGQTAANLLSDPAAAPLPVLVAYGCNRPFVPIDSNKISFEATHRTAGYLDALTSEPYWQEMANWLARRRGAQLQVRNGGPADLMAVQAAVREASEGVQVIEHDFVLNDTVARERPDRPAVRFNNLSDGYRRVVGMVTDIARRCAMLNPHLGAEAVTKTPGVVLIDEIDLHLHPMWQRTIVDSLKRAFPLVQFIATTHSPFIIQSLRPGELIRLDGDPDRPDVDFTKMSPEDIAEQFMQLDVPQRSAHLGRLQEAARAYKALLMASPPVTADELRQAKEELDAALSPYASDLGAVAFTAIMEAERQAREAER